MKLFFGITLIILLSLLYGCGPSYKAIQFEKMRTPINPIAHKGVNEYTPVAHLEYAQQPLREQEYYVQEVKKRKQEYQQALDRYNNASIVERVTQGLVEPTLILPEAPVIPYMINTAEFESRIKIDGMKRSEGNGLKVNIYFEGFQYDNIRLEDTIKTRNKNGVQVTDSIFSASTRVRHPLRIKVVAPNGESYRNNIPASRSYKQLQTQKFTSRYKAENKLYEMIQNEEQNLYKTHATDINGTLNSQFGTQLMQYTVNLYQKETDKNHNYSDLEEANILAQIGFKELHNNPNKAYENLTQAYGIWKSALSEHESYKKARINDKVRQGILINLLATATYTDNWEDAMKYSTLLDNSKLTAQTTTEFQRLKKIHRDLKSRYDALRQ
ncbi:hypothetical protein CW751_01970 [Brumimicrobium salinarum]|uniref:Lipoprotein n=1 Tax=Brumimicrobium salinarum TaxID=2058658 RepID=A0A2I0R6C0_9FLAO|nr:hypothetical protein [Brumimicrobium salinarum]PKR82128.1 hypothetical protein CW751_01970 [Brumimicrobium salinarum]